MTDEPNNPRPLLNYTRFGRHRLRNTMFVAIATIAASLLIFRVTLPYIRASYTMNGMGHGSQVNPSLIAAVAKELRLSSYTTVYSLDDSSRDTSWWCKIQIDR